VASSGPGFPHPHTRTCYLCSGDELEQLLTHPRPALSSPAGHPTREQNPLGTAAALPSKETQMRGSAGA